MEPIKAFSNVVIGQFVLTRIPIKVYVDSRYLTITSTDDVQDPLIGFGMDEDGQMHRFDYRRIEQLSISGNIVTLDTYNKALGVDTGEDSKEEEPEEEPKKEESIQMSEITRKVKVAREKAYKEELLALKDKETALKLKQKELKAEPIEDGIIREAGYTWEDIKTFGDFQNHISNLKVDKNIKTGKDVAKAITLGFLPGWVGNVDTAIGFLKKAINQDDAKKASGFIGKLDVDDELQDIVDDTIEDNFLKYIEKFVMSQPANTKIGDDFSMNKKLQTYIAKEFDERTISGFEESVNEMHHNYTFGTGDIVKNINPSCEHFGSIGVIKKIIDLPNGMGKAAVYTVGNSGATYKPGMGLTKTLDQLEKYNGWKFK